MFSFWNNPVSRGHFRQYWAAITVNLGMMLGGEYFGWPSPTLPKIHNADPFIMDHPQITLMVSLLYVGNIISPIPTGYFMDCFGRKRTLIYTCIFPVGSWALTFYATCPQHLYIARVLGGLWVGIITTVAPMYSGEIAEPKIRGALGNMFSFMTYVGTLLMYAVGPYISYYTLALVGGLSSIVFFILLLMIPESPYYYLIHKDKERARKSLRWLRGGIDEDKLELQVIAMEETVLRQTNNRGSIKAIYQTKANRKAFLIVELYAFFVKFAGIGIIMAFSSVTLPKSAFTFIGPSECALILAIIWVASSTVSILLVDWLGRKVLLTLTSLGCCFTLFSAGLWFYLDSMTSVNVDTISWIPFVCFILHGLFYCMGLGPVGTAIKGEFLSADIRANVSAITSIMFALSSLFLNQTYLPVADNIGMFANYWLYSANCLICAVFTICVFIETKGKTLQEIQDRLAKKKSLKFKGATSVLQKEKYIMTVS